MPAALSLALMLLAATPLAPAAPAVAGPGAEAATSPARLHRTNRKRWREPIRTIARRHRLDPALLHAVITVESAYHPNAISSAGAIGPMQLMPFTAERFGVDPFDPIANIDAGARYLRLLLNRFGTIQLALAAYHAGEGRVQRGRNTIPPIATTRRYVVSVLKHYMRYKKAGY